MGPRGLSQLWSSPTGWVPPGPRPERGSGGGGGGVGSPQPAPHWLPHILQGQTWPTAVKGRGCRRSGTEAWRGEGEGEGRWLRQRARHRPSPRIRFKRPGSFLEAQSA